MCTVDDPRYTLYTENGSSVHIRPGNSPSLQRQHARSSCRPAVPCHVPGDGKKLSPLKMLLGFVPRYLKVCLCCEWRPAGYNLRLADSPNDAGQEAAVVPSARQTPAVPPTAPSAPADAPGSTTVTTKVAALIPSDPRPPLLCILKLPQGAVCDSRLELDHIVRSLPAANDPDKVWGGYPP